MVQYHSHDFDWEEHARAVEAEGILEQQSAEEGGSIDTLLVSEELVSSASQENAWETFFQTYGSTGNFYKPRRYLVEEFPELKHTCPLVDGKFKCQLEEETGPGPKNINISHDDEGESENAVLDLKVGGTQQCAVRPAALTLLELGCGYGCSILPILQENPHITAYACDLSPTALAILRQNPLLRDPALAGRLRLCALDAAGAAAAPWPPGFLPPGGADAALMTFVLSALPPGRHPAALARAAAALRPGGLLFLRDYGRYDLTQLRAAGRRVGAPGRHLHRRGDGTLAYFFEPSELAALAAGAGLRVLECEWCTVEGRNRRTGRALRRVFVHGKFRRPVEEEEGEEEQQQQGGGENARAVGTPATPCAGELRPTPYAGRVERAAHLSGPEESS